MEKIDKAKKSVKTTKGEKEKAKMKYEFDGVECASKIHWQWDKLTDIDLGNINIDECRQQVLVNLKTKEAWKLKKRGIAKEIGFPPALISLELIFRCRECYHKPSRRIVTMDGRVLADLTPMSIRRTFGITLFIKMEEASKEYAHNVWKVDPTNCKRTINQIRLIMHHGSANKCLKIFIRVTLWRKSMTS